MPEPYTTEEGDSVDLIAFNHYGRSDETAEAILWANPGLAAKGPVFPRGLKITLPDVPPPKAPPTRRLWGDVS